MPDLSAAPARRDPAEQRLARRLILLPGTPEPDLYRSSRRVALRSFAITVAIEAGEDVLVSPGDQGGGYSLYVEDGRLCLAYNEYAVLHETDAGSPAAGEHTVGLAATAVRALPWSFTLTVYGEVRASPRSVHQLIGMAPFQDRSKVSGLLAALRAPPLLTLPGPAAVGDVPPRAAGAPDSPEVVASALAPAAAAFE